METLANFVEKINDDDDCALEFKDCSRLVKEAYDMVHDTWYFYGHKEDRLAFKSYNNSHMVCLFVFTQTDDMSLWAKIKRFIGIWKHISSPGLNPQIPNNNY